MFEELGLNVARQPDNGANPRPDNRSGWLEGETPRDADRRADRPPGRGATSGIPRPSCGRQEGQDTPPLPDRGQGRGMTDVAASGSRSCRRAGGPPPAPAADRRPAGPARAARRQRGAAALLEQLPRPRRPPARARGGRRGGDALGRRRRRLAADLGQHDSPPPARGAAGRVQGLRGGAAVRLRLPRQHRRDRGARRRRARSSSPTSSTTPASSTAAGSRGPRPSSTATATSSTSPGACARPSGRGALIVTDGVFSMDGDVAPLAGARRAGAALRLPADGRRGARAPARSARAAAARSPTPASRARST